MRKLHRSLAVVFGLFLLWISATGFLSQVGNLVNNGGFGEEVAATGARQAEAVGAALIPAARAHGDEHDEEVAVARPASGAAIAPAAPTFTCPADMTCRVKRVPRPGEWNLSALHHLHSGETFGPLGVVISMLSGLALFFFAASGLYLYIQMYRGRLVRTEAGKSVKGGRLFW